MREVNKQIYTERGLIHISREYDYKEEAVEDGYMYMFTSHKQDADIYGISLDDKGLRHECVLVKR